MQIINIYGGGPSALILAYELSKNGGFVVHIYEKNKALGRKFLVAGKGGFNLSHNLSSSEIVSYYEPNNLLHEALKIFPPATLQNWFQVLGINTYVGSSNRIFPIKGIKPIEVLSKIISAIQKNKNVNFHFNHSFCGFKDGKIQVRTNETLKLIEGAFHIFALGGKSWKITGSDGIWAEYFRNEGIHVNEFEPSNCGLEVNWPLEFKKSYAGKPLKNIEVSFKNTKLAGELMISDYGIEGNSIYPISNSVYRDLLLHKTTEITIDLKKTWLKKEIQRKLANAKGNTVNRLRTIKLSTTAIALLKLHCNKEEWLDWDILSAKMKSLKLTITGTRPIDEAISTRGGIATAEITSEFELKKKKNHFVIGEMIDWDTQTGGFLLQGCFSMGFFLSQKLLDRSNS